jgi:phage shock protein PspC (stress-responsive transcriptional regulator)
MNKVVTINLNGTAYQLEDQGYDALLTYLSDAANKLAGNPDKDEIIADIEQAIGDKCRATLTAFKTVVLTKEVQEIIAQMGSVDDGSEPSEKPAGGSGAAAAPAPEAARPAGTRPKRLYRIREGSMVGGVCAGLAAYFEIDPTIVRLAFALIAILTYGTGLLAYFVMMIVVPYATSEADKADAYGVPLTAREFIKRAKEGYYEGMKSFGDRRSRREWQRRFKRDMRDWGRSMKREARQHGHWFHEWHHSATMPRPSLAAAIIFPIVGLFGAILTIAMVLTLISLITTGAIFGTLLPAGMPVWLAVVLLIIAYNVALLPLRIAKGVFYYGHWTGRRIATFGLELTHTFFWICLVAFGVWYANRHLPEVHRFISQIDPAVHSAIHSFKDWWARQ